MTARPDDLAQLRELVNHRHVVEILDALSNGAQTLAALSAGIPARRRGLANALRVIAAHGLITTDSRGSWDRPMASTETILLTDRGLRAVEALSNLAVWARLYEQTDHAGTDSGQVL
jgi:DNA-binding HxlR family transcriptional regulator